jgi:hypothetical protein
VSVFVPTNTRIEQNLFHRFRPVVAPNPAVLATK